MIELGEGVVLATQLNTVLNERTIKEVLPPTNEHKFTWFTTNPLEYPNLLNGKKFIQAVSFGIFVELQFEGINLGFQDGVNIRYYDKRFLIPDKYQLVIKFDDDSFLVMSVAMYGGILCYQGELDNKYYHLSKYMLSPLNDKYDFNHFSNLLKEQKKRLSLKAFLATEQRIPGIGNGSCLEILFQAHLHPKRKIDTLSKGEIEELFYCIKAVFNDIIARNGRDSEKDIFGKNGQYKTTMSSKGSVNGCPHCGAEIIKEAYLGGSIYYCPQCQKENQE